MSVQDTTVKDKVMSIEAELQNTTMELVPEDEIVEPNDRMELQVYIYVHGVAVNGFNV